MRRFHRLIILSALFCSCSAHALGVFIDALDWLPTETNDWAYVNSEQVPHQLLDYKTINFSYTPGFRIGVTYKGCWDALASYTRLNATTNDSVPSGNIQPSFLGSVTAKPFPPGEYLYSSGQVRQTIDYNVFDINAGKQFALTSSIQIHPYAGLIGAKINQSIFASYFGSTTAHEKITNDFSGIGPKIGLDTAINPFIVNNFEPSLMIGFAASYLLGYWDVSDTTQVIPANTINVDGANHRMGATALQAYAGFKLNYKNASLKIMYEMNDWLDQVQFFDNDTGAHNNDLILQGISVGIAYDFC